MENHIIKQHFTALFNHIPKVLMDKYSHENPKYYGALINTWENKIEELKRRVVIKDINFSIIGMGDFNTYELKENENGFIIEVLHIYNHNGKCVKIRIDLNYSELKCNLLLFNYKSLKWEPTKLHITIANILKNVKLKYDVLLVAVKALNSIKDSTKYYVEDDVDLFSRNNLLEFFSVLDLIYKNPSICLVFNFFKHEVVNIYANYHVLNTSPGIKVYYTKNIIAYNYSATNVRNFLKCSKNIFSWLNELSYKIRKFNLISSALSSSNNFTESLLILKELFNGVTYKIPALVDLYYLRNLNDYEKEYLLKFYRKSNLESNDSLIYRDYIDYVRMCKTLDIKPKYKFSHAEFYIEHDEISMRIKIKYDKEEFNKFFNINSKLNEIFSTKIEDYIISFPTSPIELTKEGTILSHCVASYFKRVINENCIIAFLRKIDFPNQPLVTIELNTDLSEVIQARGKANREITAFEKIAIKKWLEYIKEVKTNMSNEN